MVPTSVEEVCQWKEKVMLATRGLPVDELIELYRRKADELQQKYGLQLHGVPASQRAVEPELR